MFFLLVYGFPLGLCFSSGYKLSLWIDIIHIYIQVCAPPSVGYETEGVYFTQSIWEEIWLEDLFFPITTHIKRGSIQLHIDARGGLGNQMYMYLEHPMVDIHYLYIQ